MSRIFPKIFPSIFSAIVAISLLSACSTQPQAGAAAALGGEQSLHPESGLQIVDVTVSSGDTAHLFKAELANTPESQAHGLMFRTQLGDFEAMLFPSDVPAVRSFWMKNTPLSLDIIFVGTDGRISNIAANTVPYSTESVVSVGPASAVLEIRGGRAAALGIAAGHKVSWPSQGDGQ